MWRSEIVASDAIGRLIEFWGFKRNMGRVWTILYLSDEPLTAHDLRERLQMSSGAVSMTLQELIRWGVVRKIWIQGARRDHFTAEGDLWKMVTRVFRERELVEVQELIRALEGALADLRDQRTETEEDRNRADTQRDRLEQLLSLARVGKKLVSALVSEGKMDARVLGQILLGDRRRKH